MKKVSLSLVVVGLGLVLMTGSVFAANATATAGLNVNAAVGNWAKLSLGQAGINFANTDPDTPSINNTEGPVNVTAKARTSSGSNVTLTVKAGGDLASGSDTIPIGKVAWTATGTGYQSGSMSSASEVAAGTWSSPASGTHTGTFSYTLVNDWSYATGSYSAIATYTLTAP